MSQFPRLEDWYVGDHDELIGFVYGDARFPDGTPIKTSRVVTWDAVTYRAITKNTEYVLGKPKQGANICPKPEST